jgi:hypothetical protein
MIHQAWPVNLLIEEGFLTNEDNEELLKTILPEIDKFNGVPEIFNRDIKIPNLFLEDKPIIQKFKAMVKNRLYQMLHAEGFIDPDSLEIQVNAFPRRFIKGMRARPHTHRGIDYTSVYYLDLEVTDEGKNTCDNDDGRLLLIDPIAQRSRGLNHNMLIQLIPKPRLFIMHPSYVFHESEMYKGDKDRILIVVNAKVKDRQQADSFITI